MGTQALAKVGERMPSVFDDFFKPWNEWFDKGGLLGRAMNVPAVNITEHKDEYHVSLAAPGLKKVISTLMWMVICLPLAAKRKRARKKKIKSLPGKSTAIHLSAAVLPCLKKSTRKKLKQSMKLGY